MKCPLFLFSVLFPFFIPAQIISRFTWDSSPITAASVGPNATSVGSSATSSSGGVGGTNGLNPGLPKADINLVVPNTGGLFDVPNIDISIDYRRNESTASLIKRGTFTFNATNNPGNFQVIYRINNGTTAGLTVTGGTYTVPIDNTYRNYRFTYDNCAGIGRMYVDNAVVWTSAATPGQNLYWNGDGNLVIGQDMDGNGNNIVNLDNFVMSNYTCSTLPVTLLTFTGKREGTTNVLLWTTAEENKNLYFTIERSIDGIYWSDFMQLPGAGESTGKQSYKVSDNEPANGINYYRLSQTDTGGQRQRFGIISVDNTHSGDIRMLRITDILGRDVDDTFTGLKFIYYSDGQVLRKSVE